MLINTHLTDCAWPAVPDDASAQALALQFQLEHSQWLDIDRLNQRQHLQLQCVLKACALHIPYWRKVLASAGIDPGATLTAETLRQLPILRRRDVQAAADHLLNRTIHPAHGRIIKSSTSGSTGEPVRFYQTAITQHYWRALTLREHFWQRRDFSGKLAVIRSNTEAGRSPNWGPATWSLIQTGPACSLNIRTDISTQLDWLAEENPDYLLTHPSNLKALAVRAIECGVTLPRLRQLRTFGELLTVDTIMLCRRAWNAGIADIYSSEEAGYIAFQCERGSYHVQAESLIVEIVDEADVACAEGQSGRVLITTLQNFAMPLIRYEIGDYAEAGGTCGCGRGLPLLQRIRGRQRNMLRLPDGTRHWPSFPEERWVGIAPIQRLQVVQKALDRIVLQICAERPLTDDESARLASTFAATLKFPHQIQIEQLASFTRTDKFEDFICEVA